MNNVGIYKIKKLKKKLFLFPCKLLKLSSLNLKKKKKTYFIFRKCFA